MKTSLPARPNLDHLRKQAKQLLSDLRDGKDDAARTFIEHLPAAKNMTPARVRAAGLRLADAQSAIARKSGFAGWPGLARHVDDLRSLEGEWHFASLEIDGREMPAAMASQSRLLIDGDRFRMESPEAVYDGIFTLDAESDPPRIDVEFIEGPEAGNWSYGIYRLNGDDLTLCVGLTGAARREGFSTAAGSGHALERLRRLSAARPAAVTGGRRKKDAAPVEAVTAIDETGFEPAMTPLLERLEGEWIPVTLITDGVPLADAMLSYGARTMHGNETKVTFGGQVMVHARVRIDESQSPVAIDYLNVGRGAKAITRGIMEAAEDRVRFCMAPAGAPRPSAFTSAKGSGTILSEWRRK